MSRKPRPPRVFATGGERGAALFLDLALCALLAAPLTELGVPPAIVVPLVVILVFVAVPASPLQGSPGKFVCRIRLGDRQGGRLPLRRLLLRVAATAAWCVLAVLAARPLFRAGVDAATAAVFVLVVQLPWAAMGLLQRRESLFDRLAGSLVVRIRAEPAAVAAEPPLEPQTLLNRIGTVVGCALLAMVLGVTLEAQHERERFARIVYAIDGTAPLREAVERFHRETARWPVAADLAATASGSYPDGGGYALDTDGRVVIHFSVLPDLAGRDIVFTPRAEGDATYAWQCSADPQLPRRYLPRDCRPSP